jgi:hypothetical protein
MSHWSDLPAEHITAALQGDTRMDFSRRQSWDTRQQAALNQALINQTLLTSALTNLLTEVQIAVSYAPSIRLLQAEQEAVRALQMVGRPADAAAEPAVAEI